MVEARVELLTRQVDTGGSIVRQEAVEPMALRVEGATEIKEDSSQAGPHVASKSNRWTDAVSTIGGYQQAGGGKLNRAVTRIALEVRM